MEMRMKVDKDNDNEVEDKRAWNEGGAAGAATRIFLSHPPPPIFFSHLPPALLPVLNFQHGMTGLVPASSSGGSRASRILLGVHERGDEGSRRMQEPGAGRGAGDGGGAGRDRKGNEEGGKGRGGGRKGGGGTRAASRPDVHTRWRSARCMTIHP
eukprot:288069-Hanusia_phi.AAC.1